MDGDIRTQFIYRLHVKMENINAVTTTSADCKKCEMIMTNISSINRLLNAQNLEYTQDHGLPSAGDASPEPQEMKSDPVFEALLEAVENGEAALTDFAALVQFMTKVLGEITTNIFGELGGWTHTTTDKKGNTSVYIDIDKIYAAFDDMFSKYPGYTKSTPPTPPTEGPHFDHGIFIFPPPHPGTKGTPPHFGGAIDTGLSVKNPPTIAEWRTQLSPLFMVDDSGKVSIDTGTLNKLIDSVRDFASNGGGKPPGVNAAAYQAWSTGFTAIKDQLMNSLQVLAEKYSHQSSNFDGMSKILSSSITAMLDTAKSYLNI